MSVESYPYVDGSLMEMSAIIQRPPSFSRPYGGVLSPYSPTHPSCSVLCQHPTAPSSHRTLLSVTRTAWVRDTRAMCVLTRVPCVRWHACRVCADTRAMCVLTRVPCVCWHACHVSTNTRAMCALTRVPCVCWHACHVCADTRVKCVLTRVPCVCWHACQVCTDTRAMCVLTRVSSVYWHYHTTRSPS